VLNDQEEDLHVDQEDQEEEKPDALEKRNLYAEAANHVHGKKEKDAADQEEDLRVNQENLYADQEEDLHVAPAKRNLHAEVVKDVHSEDLENRAKEGA
tara:strand:+ start:296 stop:589 length:294 start_codon:yes stop_codon:yes gene_type:complete